MKGHMSNLATEVISVIADIKQVVATLNDQQNSDVMITSFSLNLKTVLETSIGVDGGMDLFLVKLGQKQGITQTLEMEFELAGQRGGRRKTLPIATALTSAGHAIDSALREATKGVSGFQLNKGRVELSFVVERNCEFNFNPAKAVLNNTNTNTITLNVASKSVFQHAKKNSVEV
jgi:hypothetical protein